MRCIINEKNLLSESKAREKIKTNGGTPVDIFDDNLDKESYYQLYTR